MNETAIRELLQQAMAEAEPPPGPHIIGGAVRAARRTRRRHWAAGIGAAAIIVPGLALGVPAVVGALSQAAPAGHARIVPAAVGAPRAHTKGHARTPSAIPMVFQRPAGLVSTPEVNPVPITSQSVGQLLIDDLPAGTRTSQIQADKNFSGTGVAYAYFNNVSTPIGAGLLQATMMRAGSRPFNFGCVPAFGNTCRDYTLPGGVVVEEHYESTFAVSVFRPNVAEINIDEANFAEAAGSPETKGMPLTIGQLLKIALDGRWQFTISQSFVQHASGLHIVPINTSGS
jgi:hypothetical protein